MKFATRATNFNNACFFFNFLLLKISAFLFLILNARIHQTMYTNVNILILVPHFKHSSKHYHCYDKDHAASIAQSNLSRLILSINCVENIRSGYYSLVIL